MSSYPRFVKAGTALKNNILTYGGLPQTNTTMDRPHILLNTGKNDTQVSNNLTNTKIRFIFIDMNDCLQSTHSLAQIPDGNVVLLSDNLLCSQRVLLGNKEAVTACFVSISDKADATKGNLRYLDDPGIEDLKAATGSMFVTPALIGMANEGADPHLIILPKLFPFEIGESALIGHHIKDALPKCTVT